MLSSRWRHTMIFGFFYLCCLWLNMRTGTLHLSGPLSKKWPRALISQLYLPPGWISGALLQMSLASLAGAPDRGLYHQAQDLLSCGLLEHRGRGRWQGAGWCRHLCHVWFSQVHRLCCCRQRAEGVLGVSVTRHRGMGPAPHCCPFSSGCGCMVAGRLLLSAPPPLLSWVLWALRSAAVAGELGLQAPSPLCFWFYLLCLS